MKYDEAIMQQVATRVWYVTIRRKKQSQYDRKSLPIMQVVLFSWTWTQALLNKSSGVGTPKISPSATDFRLLWLLFVLDVIKSMDTEQRLKEQTGTAWHAM